MTYEQETALLEAVKLTAEHFSGFVVYSMPGDVKDPLSYKMDNESGKIAGLEAMHDIGISFNLYFQYQDRDIPQEFALTPSRVKSMLSAIRKGKEPYIDIEGSIVFLNQDIYLEALMFYLPLHNRFIIRISRLEWAQKLAQRLSRDASMDITTGLPQKREFLAELEKTRAGKGNFLLFADINDFKGVNDNHGHLEGDKALAAFSFALKKAAKKNFLPFRFAGDEFAIIVTRSSLREIENYLNEVDRLMRDPIGTTLSLTFACGIAEGSPTFRSEEDWIRLADAGMYKAKALKELYYVVSSEEAKKILAEK